MKKVLIILMLILINNAALAQNIENEEYTAENIINFISRMDIEDVDDAMYFLREYTHNAYNNDNYTAGKYFVKEIKSDEELADIGFKYADDNKSRLACSDAFINGDIKSRLFNKPMDNILILNSQLEKSIKVLENYLAEKEDETGEVYLIISYAYFLKDMFYNYDKISYYFNKFISINGDTAIENITRDMRFIAEVLSVVTKFQGDNVVDFYNHAVENGYIDNILMTSGYADIYNDGFYHNFAIVKNNAQSILVIDEAKLSYDNENLYANLYYKIFGDNNTDNPMKYEPEHCTDYVYQGNLYVLPFNKKYYLVNTSEVENNIKTISIKNPAYFNVNYGRNYNNKDIFKDDKTAKALHGVSQMGKFSYKDNVIYEVKYDKEPQSPAGDVDTLANMYDYSKPLTYAQIKDYVKDRNYEKAIMNSKYSQRDIEKYMEFLSFYSKYPIKADDYDLLFYDIGKKDPVYAACIIDKKTNNITQYFIVDKRLNILNEDLAKAVSDFTDSDLWNYNVKIIYKENNPQMIYLRRDGQVLVVNILDGKAGFNTFPAYYIKNKQEIKKLVKEKNLFNLNETANIDCNNANENEALQLICSSRELLSHKAYLEVLYKEKQEKMDKNYYPEKVKQYYMISYDNMNNETLSCSNKECISDVFFKYQELFLK